MLLRAGGLLLVFFSISISLALSALPDREIRHELIPPILTYNRTAKLVFSLGPPKCAFDKFRLTQNNEIANFLKDWGYNTERASFHNESTFLIQDVVFSDWGSYSAQCYLPYFVYNPFPFSVPIPVNPRIFTTNFTTLAEDLLTTTTTTTTTMAPDANETWSGPFWPEPLDENGPTTFVYPVWLGKDVETWVLKFDVGDGYYPNAERGFFNLSGLDNFTNYVSSTKREFVVPYAGFPNGTSYRYTFDLSTEVASSKMPSICDFPLNASVWMKSNPAASLHSYNVTLRLKYQAQNPSIAARTEGPNCIFRCSIRSACPLLESLQLKLEAPGGKVLPVVSSEQTTWVEAKITSEDCDTIVQLYQNNTGTVKCTAKNEVAAVNYELPLRDVPGIRNLERDMAKKASGEGLPLWAKITIPVACILVVLLFIGVIVLCCQKRKIAKQKARHSAELKAAEAAAAATATQNQQHLEQTQALNTTVLPPAQPVQPQPVAAVVTVQRVSNNSNSNSSTAAYRGPVSTRGNTYQMPVQEMSAIPYDEDVDEQEEETADNPSWRYQPPGPRVLPPTPGSWEGSFSYTTTQQPRQPTTNAPPVPRLGGYSRPPAAAPPPVPVTSVPTMMPPIGYKPESKSRNGSQDSLSNKLEREDSYVTANRKAANRYVPPAPAPKPPSSSSNTSYNPRPPYAGSGSTNV